MPRQEVRPATNDLPFSLANVLEMVAHHNSINYEIFRQFHMFGSRTDDPIQWLNLTYPGYGPYELYIKAHEQTEQFFIKGSELLRAKEARKREEEERKKMFQNSEE